MRADLARLQDGTPLAAPGAMDDLRRHALAVYPEECIGYLDATGCYIRLRNTAAHPELSAIASASELAELMHAGDLRALCHSHPGGPDCPSEQDMRAQIEMMVPFVIVSTNGQACTEPFAWGDELLNDEPLIGRQFRHGVTDCYALIRDWYRVERGVELPEYPRNWEWWSGEQPGEQDLYRRHFAEAGFYQIDPREAREGDVWLAAVRSSVPNHAGIYLDAGLALHHPSSGLACDPVRLSKREGVARWQPYITHWLRRD